MKRWGGWVGEWVAVEGWGDKGLVCKCHDFPVISEKTAAIDMMPSTDTIVVFENTTAYINVSPRKNSIIPPEH